MKYVLINDILYVIKYKLKIILFYLFSFIFYYVLLRKSYLESGNNELINYLFNNIFGIKYCLKNSINDIFSLTLVILNYTMYFYISIIILIKDFDNFDNLFSRLPLRKLMVTKVIVSFIISLVMNTIVFLVPLIFGDLKINMYLLVIKKVIIIIIVDIYLYIIYMIKNKNIALLILALLPLIFIILYSDVNLYQINMLILLFVLLLIGLLFLFVSLKTKYVDLKEWCYLKIEMKEIFKNYKKNMVLSDVNLMFEEGNIYGFIGRNGSGKTVLLKILCGYITPSSGDVY